MNGISAEARGTLRLFKTEAGRHRAAVTRLMPTLGADAKTLVERKNVRGRARVFERMHTRLSPHARLWDARLNTKAPLALWAYLKPRGGVVIDPDDPGDAQDCVSVEYILAGAVLGPDSHGTSDGLWSLECSDHAVHRLLERDPGANITEALFAAHRATLLLPTGAVAGPETIMLRAGAGLFLCEPRFGKDASVGANIHLRAKTWLHADQLRAGQKPSAAGQPGDRLGDGWLLPPELRALEETTSGTWQCYTPAWLDEGFGIPRHGTRHQLRQP